MRYIDILRTLAILLAFGFILSYSKYTGFIGDINKNWEQHKCNPFVMPFASVFGHNATKNFEECINIQQKFSMGTFLAPIEYALALAGNLGGNLTGSINKIREFFNYLRNMIIKTVKTIFNIFFSIIIAFTKIIIKTKDLTMRILGAMVVTLYMVDGTAKTGQSIWKGPPGKIMRLLCFHPNTTVSMKNGHIKCMKDIRVGDTLFHNNRVIGILELQGSKTNPFYKIYSESMKSNILVTGVHKIQDPDTGRFIPVSQFHNAKKTNEYSDKMSCLITDDHLIPIGEYIFWDWED